MKATRQSPSPRPGFVRCGRNAGTLLGAFAILALVLGRLASDAIGAAAPVPDFHLEDVNPVSKRSTQIISPRDYRMQISAYYFGNAG